MEEWENIYGSDYVISIHRMYNSKYLFISNFVRFPPYFNGHLRVNIGNCQIFTVVVVTSR